MEIVLFVVAVVVAFLCWGMLNNCLSIMKNVERGEKNDRTPEEHRKRRIP